MRGEGVHARVICGEGVHASVVHGEGVHASVVHGEGVHACKHVRMYVQGTCMHA